MNGSNRMTVVGVFEDWKKGQSALHDLLHSGFAKEQLGIVARGGENWVWDSGQRRQKAADRNAAATDCEDVGAGAEVLWSLGIAAGEPSRLGPTIAGGSFTPMLEADAILIDQLRLRGVPEEDARYYEDKFQSGGTLVMANVGARSFEAARIMDQGGACASLVARDPTSSCAFRN